MAPGLRERKNERTRRAIQRAALELTLEQGYEATSVAQIAERADVSPRTVHTWFPHKDEIVFVDDEAPLERLREHLTSDEGTTVDQIERWLTEQIEAAPPEPDELDALRLQAMMTDPYLRGRLRGYLADMEDDIARGVARDTGLAPEEAGPRAWAAAVTATLLTVIDRTYEARDEPLAQLDQGLRMLRGGLEALRPR